MTNPNGTRMVFNMKYAGKLMKMGHVILETMPNPRNPQLDMFLFAADDTFDEDFKLVQEEGKDGR